ncbi:MAG TPA: serine hydrolase domain-containing protein [Candidatus Brocadiaceae bacterium]
MKLFPCKTIRIPDDLTSVTSYKLADEVNPSEAGMSQEEVQALWAGVEDLYRSGIHPAISFCLRRQGKVVLKRAIGHARGNGPDDTPNTEKILATPDTPICLFSVSKAATAMLIHLLDERGQIHLMDPVSYYIPEFVASGKENITIHHILSHRGGIPNPPRELDPEIIFNHDEIVKLLCKAKPVSPGGRRTAYHAITGGFILGEIVHRVTGKDLRELLHETVQKPLGFRYFNFGVPEEETNRVAVNYYTGVPLIFPFTTIIKRALGASWKDVVRISNDSRFMKVIIPCANLFSTADEVSRFFQLLLNKGELDGMRIFNPLTIYHAIMEVGKPEVDRTVMIPMRYGAGMILGNKPIGMYGPFTQHAFGHLGFSNIFCWADPERDIVVSLLTTGKAMLGPHIIPLARLLLRISWHCRKKSGH